MSKRTINPVKINGELFSQSILDSEHRPHWKNYGDGTLCIDISGHSKGKWLSFDVTERGEQSSKRVMYSLSENEIRALRDLCDKALNEPAADSPVAAAPEMYALLKELIDIEEGPCPGSSTWAKKVYAVLAKVEGKRPTYTGPLNLSSAP